MASAYHFVDADEGRRLAPYLGRLKDGRADGPFATEAAQLAAAGDVTALVRRCAAVSGVLLASNEPLPDIEAAYKVLIVLADDASPDTLPELVAALVQPILADSVTAVAAGADPRTFLKARVLSILFNIIAPANPLRYDVFTAVLDVLAASNDISVVLPQLAHLPQWLDQWNATDSQRAAIYKKLATHLAATHELDSAFEWLAKYVATKQGAADPTALNDAIVQAIALPTHLRFNHLIEIPSISAVLGEELPQPTTFPPVLPSLSKSNVPELYKLLDIFARGTYRDYVAFAEKYHAFIQSTPALSDDACRFKIRILTIASLATSNELPGEITYAKIAESIGCSDDEVEVWIINAIRAGLIDARMNQLHKTLSVTRASYRQFTKADWELLEKKLKAANVF